MLLRHVNRLQRRASGPFRRAEHMQQCPGGRGADGFVAIVQGGFQLWNNAAITDVTKGTEGDRFGAGKRILY
jgi:hypothetical protein